MWVPMDAPRRGLIAAVSAALVGLLAGTAAPLAAADFAPITEEQKALKEVPGDPSAPGVVLFEKAYCKLLDYPRDQTSRLDVEVRIKILTPEGLERVGEVEIGHSRYRRLHDFTGRTVLPDGRVIPLPKDAIFQDTTSRARREFVTKAAFPALEVGAIIDYKYSMHWDSFFFLEPWIFTNAIPTLRSEITYAVPKTLAVKPWAKQTSGVELQFESDRAVDGRLVRVWAENLRAVPDEPVSFPYIDLATRFMVVPTEFVASGSIIPLMQSWDTTCDILHDGYEDARKGSRNAIKVAKSLTVGQRPRQKAETLYRFVRDEIQNNGLYGVIGGSSTVGEAIKERRGSAIQKALTLEAMLDAVGLQPELVLAPDRREGRVDLTVPNPWWFERGLIALSLEGQRLYLDPVDPHGSFGRLHPDYEGMAALIHRPKNPEVIELPRTPASDHRERAEVELAVDSEGAVAGSGRIESTGHRAWLRRALAGDDPDEYWTDRLGKDYPNYQVEGVEVNGARAEDSLIVTWNLKLREEEILGDEVTLAPSRPFGPRRTTFSLPPKERRTPVQLFAADTEEVQTTITWPEGWALEVRPEPHSVETPIGSSTQTVTFDEESRKLVVSRSYSRTQSEIMAGPPYQQLYMISTATEKGDAQPVVVAAR